MNKTYVGKHARTLTHKQTDARQKRTDEKKRKEARTQGYLSPCVLFVYKKFNPISQRLQHINLIKFITMLAI